MKVRQWRREGWESMSTVDSIFRRQVFEANVVTSTATLRRVMASPTTGFTHDLAGMRTAGVVRRGMKFGTVLRSISAWMSEHYRSEPLYKNALVEQLLTDHHELSTSTVLPEFRLGDSIADCVILNGHAHAYEIKTELDRPTKLGKQLADYTRGFDRVSVVTHASLAHQYASLLNGTNVGLVVLEEAGRLSTRRDAVVDRSGLEVSSMVKALRKPEYTAIAEQIAGRRIVVPAVDHFRACLRVSETVGAADYRERFEATLRERRLAVLEKLGQSQFKEVRHQLLAIGPGDRQLANLSEWMNRKL